MKKIIGYTIFVLLILLLFAGCSPDIDSSKGEGSISVKISTSVSKGTDTDLSLETVAYEIILSNGPEGFSGITENVSASETEVLFEHLTPGTYQVTVNAKNRDNLIIGSGSENCIVSIGKPSPCVITVKEVSGNGNLFINTHWDYDLASNPVITVTLTPQGGEAMAPFELSVSGNAATSVKTLSNGFYNALFSISYDGAVVDTYSDTFRVAANADTNMDVDIRNILSGDIRITINNEIVAPPHIDLIVTEAGAGFEKKYIIKANIRGVIGDYTSQWTLNGAVLSETSTNLTLSYEDVLEGNNSLVYRMSFNSDTYTWTERTSFNYAPDFITYDEVKVNNLVLDSNSSYAITGLDKDKYYLLSECNNSNTYNRGIGFPRCSSVGFVFEASIYSQGQQFLLLSDDNGNLQINTGNMNIYGLTEFKIAEYDRINSNTITYDDSILSKYTGYDNDSVYIDVLQVPITGATDLSKVIINLRGSCWSWGVALRSEIRNDVYNLEGLDSVSIILVQKTRDITGYSCTIGFENPLDVSLESEFSISESRHISFGPVAASDEMYLIECKDNTVSDVNYMRSMDSGKSLHYVVWDDNIGYIGNIEEKALIELYQAGTYVIRKVTANDEVPEVKKITGIGPETISFTIPANDQCKVFELDFSSAGVVSNIEFSSVPENNFWGRCCFISNQRTSMRDLQDIAYLFDRGPTSIQEFRLRLENNTGAAVTINATITY